jgi:hypothetical protein
MKPITPISPATLPFARLLLLAGLIWAAPGFAEETAPATPEPKTHTLYMGENFSVERNKELYPVQNVVGGSLVIKVNGKEVQVPINFGASKFKLAPTLKLTDESATVTNLKSERGYTLGNDPTVRFERGLADSEMLNAGNQAAQNQINSSFKFGTATAAAALAASIKDSHAPTGASLDQAVASQKAQANGQNIAGGPGSHFQEHGSTLEGEGMFDAMDVSFEVSSHKPLKNPYLVVIAQFHPPDGKPGEVSNWVYARELPPIGREPVKIQFLQGGFPPGFTVQNFQLHLYEQGEEIATTVAPSRVMLTRDEAFLYVVGDYVGSHKGATLPAAPMMFRLPEEVQTRVAKGEWKETFYVRVGKDGKASGAFLDESCAQPVEDPYLQSVLRNIRFKPALDKGRPVEAVAPLKLSQLPI